MDWVGCVSQLIWKLIQLNQWACEQMSNRWSAQRPAMPLTWKTALPILALHAYLFFKLQGGQEVVEWLMIIGILAIALICSLVVTGVIPS